MGLGRVILMEYKIDKRAVRERVTSGMASLSEEVKLN